MGSVDRQWDHIDEIVREMLSGTFSVFCGAGADFDATKKQWEDIFSEKTKSFYKKYSSDIYFLADLEKRYYNPEDFLRGVCANLEAVSDLKSTHINNIVNLNLNQIWTTNFDTIIENTIKRKLGITPTVIKESEDLIRENLNSRFLVYKLNGSVTSPSSMVLTKSDYFSYFKKQRLIFEMLKRQLVLDSFLFVGYSFSDDLVLNALREIKEIFPNRGKTHYRFVIRNINDPFGNEFGEFETKYYLDEYNIKSIFIDDFSDIDSYLEELYCRYCNHNVLISGSFRQLESNEERLYIEKLTHSLIQALVENNFVIYSGNGRGLGEIVVAQISDLQAERSFVNRPLIFTNDTIQQKSEKNHLIMKDCTTMIVICGQDDSLSSSQNVIRQFNDFCTSSADNVFPLVIPIPSTKYAAAEIYNSAEFRNSAAYLTNRENFMKLENETDISTITKLVVNIMLSYRSEIS